ncbi:MAG: metallophosphoesterase [Solirubrobacteraceae bacterium]
MGSTDFIVVQLTDPHIGGEWGLRDPVAALAATIESVRALNREPDAILITGDLTDGGADADYAVARELLAGLDAPLYVVAGNHDDRAALRRHFRVPGGEGRAPIQYAVALGPLRLLVLDTTIPGTAAGALPAPALVWLEAELAAAPATPTLVALHHPPLAIGIAEWDEIGLAAADREALAAVIARHRHVRRLVCGHVHRTVVGELGGAGVLAVSGSYVQAKLDLGTDEIKLADEPAAFAVHALVDGELLSHVQPVA